MVPFFFLGFVHFSTETLPQKSWPKGTSQPKKGEHLAEGPRHILVALRVSAFRVDVIPLQAQRARLLRHRDAGLQRHPLRRVPGKVGGGGFVS